MLPFLKNKQDAGAQGPVDSQVLKTSDQKDSEYDSLESAMEELHTALQAKNYKQAAEIFRSCFELLDSEPHKEGPHTDG